MYLKGQKGKGIQTQLLNSNLREWARELFPADLEATVETGEVRPSGMFNPC